MPGFMLPRVATCAFAAANQVKWREAVIRLRPSFFIKTAAERCMHPAIYNFACDFGPVMRSHLPLCSVNHISRVVSDVNASTKFYRDILGFQEVKRPLSFDFEGSWLWSYSVGIHLIEGAPVERPRQINPKADHLSFQADDLDQVEQCLTELGIHHVKQVIMESGVQVRQVFFHDPDNNMIEICNCNCLPILPVENMVSPLFCHKDRIALAANNLQCDSMQDSGDEFNPASPTH